MLHHRTSVITPSNDVSTTLHISDNVFVHAASNSLVNCFLREETVSTLETCVFTVRTCRLLQGAAMHETGQPAGSLQCFRFLLAVTAFAARGDLCLCILLVRPQTSFASIPTKLRILV